MAVAIVQQASARNDGFGVFNFDLASAVTASNLLVLVGVKIYTDSAHVLVQGTGAPRPFTSWAGVDQISAGHDDLVLAYRAATGDEQHLQFLSAQSMATLYEISGAGNPAGFEVIQATLQAAAGTKTLGTLTTGGSLQILAIEWGPNNGDIFLDQTVGTGWTQDAQDGRPAGGAVNHPGYIAAHATSNPEAKCSGASYVWGGIAVGIVSTAPFLAAFVGTPTSGFAPLSVVFTDETSGSPTAWSWTFGDGGTSTSQNPTHIYTVAGTYDVTLTASKTGATSTTTRAEYVVAHPAPQAGVFIDWAGDGFENGTYDDVTSNVMSWSTTVGAGAEITGGSQPGSGLLVLKDPSGRYNPYNASSPLYGLLRDGVPVWGAIADDGTFTGSGVNGLFAGRITDITPIPGEGTSVPPTVEIAFEDALGWYARTQSYLDYDEGRSHDALRQTVLLLAGEPSSRLALAHEIQTMPLSHADGYLSDVLGAINGVNGTRHFIAPADNFTDWYAYTTRNRFWRLDATSDGSLDAGSQHVTGTDGWRLSADTVTNRQRAAVDPVVFTSGDFVVWQAQTLPFSITTRNPQSFWVIFDDVVRDPVLNLASTGATVVSSLTVYATTARINLSVASGTATVTRLSIQARLARRAPEESFVADDTASQADLRGVRAGQDIGGEYLGVLAEARGIAQHVVWRYASPQARPTLTVVNWFPHQFQIGLYDVISFTSSQLATTARLFEVVGIRHASNLAAPTAQLHTTVYTLQESRVQSDPGWFVLDSSLLDGAKLTHY